jgi:hypothetical protein
MSYSAWAIWLQPVPSGESTRLTDENYEGISRPAWSADGREIVFAAEDALFRVPIAGGAPQAIAGVGENAGDSGISPNQMVFVQSLRRQSRIWCVRGPKYKGEDRSAAPLPVSTRPDDQPDCSPDGKKLLYLKPGQQRHGAGPIWKVPCEGGEETPVLDRESAFINWALMPEGLCFSTWTDKK